MNKVSTRKCVNIHNGIEGNIVEMDGELYVLYADMRGNVRKVLFSENNWVENVPHPKNLPRSVVLQVAFEADTKLLNIYGIKSLEWLSLHPEKKRSWLEEKTNWMEHGLELGMLRKKMFESIMQTLEPLWIEA